jgi:hypothetical protein
MKINLPFLIILIVVTILLSCAPQRIELKNEECALQKKLQIKFNCSTLDLRHDYNAITENKTNGSFDVSLCDEFCSMDSTRLKAIAIIISSEIIPLLSHKSNYKEITFYTSVEKHLSEKTSRLTCSKRIKILLSNPKNVIYLDDTYY